MPKARYEKRDNIGDSALNMTGGVILGAVRVKNRLWDAYRRPALSLEHYSDNMKKCERITGFIYGQGDPDVKDIAVGLSDTKRSGCGWIALYNALYLLNARKNPADIIRYLEEHGGTISGARYGLNPEVLKEYIARQGYAARLDYLPRNIDEKIAASRAGVLLYRWGPLGLHYIMIDHDPAGGGYRAYNVYENNTKADVFPSVEEWIGEKKYTVLALITINSKARADRSQPAPSPPDDPAGLRNREA